MNADAAVRKRGGSERDAFGMITKAAPRAPTFTVALEGLGLGLRWRPDHRRQCRDRIQHFHQSHLWRGGRR